MVATSHPLAVEAALETMRQGGNAVDAAVCAALVLGVVDPMSTSLGGDCFALVWDARSRIVRGLNGSGRAPARASVDALRTAGHDAVPEEGILAVTVPGALHGYEELCDRLGTVSMRRLVKPALVAARDGFEVTPIVARDWEAAEPRLRRGEGTEVFLPGGRAPRAGERVTFPDLAASLARVEERGAPALYQGAIGEAIVRESDRLDGWFERRDLSEHGSEWVEPVVTRYRDHLVCELPPNGQGLVVLQALRMLDGMDLATMSAGERAHVQIEALKLGFADAFRWIADPATSEVPTDALISERYLAKRRAQIGAAAATHLIGPGDPRGDTAYVCTVDREGNACSLIHSVYMHFGACVVPRGTGIVLQNRGNLFSADPRHPNALAPGKRPFHTIIPSMVMRGGAPRWVFGVVGGFQQPQAQVQILSAMIDGGMSLEDAVRAPRFRWMDGAKVRLEAGLAPEVVAELQARGHEIVESDAHGGFGGAQAIAIEADVLRGASDPRKDGCVGSL